VNVAILPRQQVPDQAKRKMRTTGKVTHQKILDAARWLIATRGYSNFSFADISAEIAVHKASIHHHFPTKSALAIAVTDLCRQEFELTMAAMAVEITDPVAQLQAYLHCWERHLINNPQAFCVAGMLGAEVPFLELEVAVAVGAYFASMTRWLEGVLAAGAASGRFQIHGSPKDEAAAFVSLVYGAVLVARATRNPGHFAEATRMAFTCLTGRDNED
jgi:TetR/AcrR family transcriptional repressor of nem operon